MVNILIPVECRRRIYLGFLISGWIAAVLPITGCSDDFLSGGPSKKENQPAPPADEEVVTTNFYIDGGKGQGDGDEKKHNDKAPPESNEKAHDDEERTEPEEMSDEAKKKACTEEWAKEELQVLAEDIQVISIDGRKLSDVTLELLDPNGYYCLYVSAKKIKSLSVAVHCSAHLAEAGVKAKKIKNLNLTKEICHEKS